MQTEAESLMSEFFIEILVIHEVRLISRPSEYLWAHLCPVMAFVQYEHSVIHVVNVQN